MFILAFFSELFYPRLLLLYNRIRKRSIDKNLSKENSRIFAKAREFIYVSLFIQEIFQHRFHPFRHSVKAQIVGVAIIHRTHKPVVFAK